MEKQSRLRRVFNSMYFEVQVNQWSPPYRTYTITTTVLLVVLLITLSLHFLTDIPGLDMLWALLFLAWLLAERYWLRSILKQDGKLPPGR